MFGKGLMCIREARSSQDAWIGRCRDGASGFTRDPAETSLAAFTERQKHYNRRDLLLLTKHFPQVIPNTVMYKVTT
jgi:hypothetical protein